MKNLFKITEEEKKQILKKYNILKEANDIGCIDGTCKNGSGTYVNKVTSKWGDLIRTSEGKFGNVEGELEGVGKKTIKYLFTDQNITEVEEGTFKKGILINGKKTTTSNNVSIIESGTFVDNKLDGNGSSDEKSAYGETKKVGNFENGNLISGTVDYDAGDIKFKLESEKITYDENKAKETYDDPKITFPNGKIIEGVGTLYKDTNFSTYSYVYQDGTSINDFNQYIKDNQSGKVATASTPPATTSSNQVSSISDELRSQWEGCESTPNDLFKFNNPEDEYVKEFPELGYYKFEGIINGKNIKVNACFDKFKLIKTYDENETGDRGTFNGTYYTDDEVEPLTFQGDESMANKFKNGTLSDSPDYNFHTSKFEYTGSFIDGLMSQGKIVFDDKSFYEGEFKNGKIEGQGKFTFPNKSFFEGEFEQYVKDDGTITYKVTMKNGGIVDDLIDYLKKLKLNYFSNNQDLSFGVLKGAKIEGIVQYKSIVYFPVDANQKEEKTFEGILPKAKVVLKSESVKIETEKIEGKTFETTTDDNGKFLLENIPYGEYSIKITFGGKLNPFFLYENKNLNINSDKKYKFSAIKTERLEKLESEITGDDISNENYNEQIIQPLLKSNKVNDNFIADLIDGTFLNKYGKTNALKTCLNQFKNYTDELKQLYFGKIETTLLKPEEDLQLTKKSLQYCWNQFKPQLSKRIKQDDISLIQQPGGKLLAYQVDLKENYNKTNIYSKGNDMNETIKNIIKEHARIKKIQTSTESKIIENRLNFIFEDSTGYTTRNKIRKNLLSEKNQLLYMGYTPKLVNEIFNRFMVKI